MQVSTAIPASRLHLRWLGDTTTPQLNSVNRPYIAAEQYRIGDGPTFEYEMVSDRHYLAFHDLMFEDGEVILDGSRPHRPKDLRRRMTYVPAGVKVRGWGQPLRRQNSFMALHIDKDVIPDELRSLSSWDAPIVHFRDQRLESILSRLDLALTRDAPFLDLLTDSMAGLALIELASARHDGVQRRGSGRRLSEGQVDAVREFISANLASPLHLDDLAAAAGLSKFHFIRAFKAAIGISPYQEVLRMRIDAARRLIGEGLPISTVSTLTGFKGAAQFARTFRRQTGQSPSGLAR